MLSFALFLLYAGVRQQRFANRLCSSREGLGRLRYFSRQPSRLVLQASLNVRGLQTVASRGSLVAMQQRLSMRETRLCETTRAVQGRSCDARTSQRARQRREGSPNLRRAARQHG